MFLCFLKPPELGIPVNVRLIENYGYEQVVSKGKIVATGSVVYVSAEPNAMQSWLGGRDIWVGNGMLGFELRRIKGLYETA